MNKLPTTIKKLEVFVCYMETLNMASVGKTLNLNALSVYRSIHELERDLGFLLFEKKGRNLAPLDSAHILYRNSVRLLSEFDIAINTAKSSAGIEPKRLRIGAVNSLTADLMPYLLSSYSDRNPDTTLTFLTGADDSLFEKLRRSEVDAILVYEHENLGAQYTSLPIFQDELQLAVATSNVEFLKSTKVSALYHKNFMVMEGDFGLRRVFDSVVRSLPLQIQIHSEFSNIFSLGYALRAGSFFSLLPKRLKSTFSAMGVTLLPLEHSECSEHSIYLVMNRANENSYAMRALVAECRMYNPTLI